VYKKSFFCLCTVHDGMFDERSKCGKSFSWLVLRSDLNMSSYKFRYDYWTQYYVTCRELHEKWLCVSFDLLVVITYIPYTCKIIDLILSWFTNKLDCIGLCFYRKKSLKWKFHRFYYNSRSPMDVWWWIEYLNWRICIINRTRLWGLRPKTWLAVVKKVTWQFIRIDIIIRYS